MSSDLSKLGSSRYPTEVPNLYIYIDKLLLQQPEPHADKSNTISRTSKEKSKTEIQVTFLGQQCPKSEL